MIYQLTTWEIEQIARGLRLRTRELAHYNGEHDDGTHLLRSLTQKFSVADGVAVECPEEITATTE